MSLFGSDSIGITLDSVARIIQMALTPVFLLTGLATLLNVFSTRLARVAARVDQTVNAIAAADPDAVAILRDQLVHLHRRSLALDTAVILGAAAGAATCPTVRRSSNDSRHASRVCRRSRNERRLADNRNDHDAAKS